MGKSPRKNFSARDKDLPARSKQPATKLVQAQTLRLNKAIADSGYCARRKADELIQAGKVKVNGQVVLTFGTQVNPTQDRIEVEGKLLQFGAKTYLLFNKPKGYVTSRKAGRGQKSIYKLIPVEQESVDPAGRLDLDSSGLLVLSDDGDFLNRITHPRYHLAKQYVVKTNRPLSPEDEAQLRAGILLEPENKLAQVQRIQPRAKAPNTYLVELITGYNRQIRRSFEALGHRVVQLHRIRFGSLSLGKLPEGQLRALTSSEIQMLLSSSQTPNQGQKSPQNENGKVKHSAQQKTDGKRQHHTPKKPKK